MAKNRAVTHRERAANAAKEYELHAYDVPVYWIAISPIEAQALIEDVVSASIQRQCVTLLSPEPWEKSA